MDEVVEKRTRTRIKEVGKIIDNWAARLVRVKRGTLMGMVEVVEI